MESNLGLPGGGREGLGGSRGADPGSLLAATLPAEARSPREREAKSRLAGVHKKSLDKKREVCGDPMSADPICPFPSGGLLPVLPALGGGRARL